MVGREQMHIRELSSAVFWNDSTGRLPRPSAYLVDRRLAVETLHKRTAALHGPCGLLTQLPSASLRCFGLELRLGATGSYCRTTMTSNGSLSAGRSS